MEKPPNPVGRALLALGSCVVLVMLAVLFVDRPAAMWVHDHLGRPAVLDWATHFVDPLRLLAMVGLAGAAIAAVFGAWRPGEHGRTVMAASLAILVSFEFKELLKYFFGRTWPETWIANNPSWINNGVYGFHLLHGGEGWSSFPSGHTTLMASLATVIWLRLPRLRWLAVTLVAVVALGLWGCDYHFLGDIIAGAYLGAACGIGMVAVVCRPDRRDA